MRYRQLDSHVSPSAKMNGTQIKEDTGKSMKDALYILQYAKRQCLAEATLNSEKLSPHP